MGRIVLVLLAIALIPMLASCASPKKAVKGTGDGITSIVEGAGTGTVELGKGAVGTVKGTAEATGNALIGRGSRAAASGKEAIDSTASGIKGIVVEPATGLGKGLGEIGTGIKESFEKDEDIK
ncbi:MAG: hypothetical protein ISS91_03290 [Candidatus Omnitrophica bacterium]|nr:hypothetical protein [Candidatus Omnitrophota bacterium]